MKYENVVEGTFLARPNRFVAKVIVDGKETSCHVKNTGRCRELLVPGCKVFLTDHAGSMGSRKMRYSLIAVMKGNTLINMDSQAPNKVVDEFLKSDIISIRGMSELVTIKREKNFGNSRFDFYLEDKDGSKGWLEVKGVTLEEDGVARFPDAPTERGTKHIHELIKARKEGYNAYIFFVIQMKGIRYFTPNYQTDSDFANALSEAEAAGVEILAYDCKVTADSLDIDEPVKIFLKKGVDN